MSNTKTNKIVMRIVDVAMTLLLLSLMAYQVTGEALHEWIGMGRKKFLLYLAFVMLFSMLSGLLINLFCA